MYNASFFSTKLGRAALISITAMIAMNAAVFIGQLFASAPGMTSGLA